MAKEGLTFNTLVGFDDIQQQFQLVLDKQRETMVLIMNGNYGIISDYDSSDSLSPLFPTLSDSSLYFTEGNAVTENGDVVKLDSFTKQLGSFTEDIALLYVYQMVGSTEKRVSNNGNPTSVWFELQDISKSLMFVKCSEYYSLSSEVRSNSICLCVLKNDEDGISLDVGQTTYSFNRPWFSPCDIEHRNELGTGDSSVPHSIGLNDLTSGSLTLYDQLLSRGIIVSKDIGISGVPGKLYKLDVYASDVETTGVYAGKSLIELDVYPNAIGSVFDSDGNNLQATLVNGTNLIVLDNYTSKKITVHFTVTETLLPPSTKSISEELTFGSQSSNDVAITQGLQTEVLDPSVSFADCGTIARGYEVVFGSNGEIHKEPEVVNYSSLLSTVVNKIYNQEFSIPVNVQIALQNAQVAVSGVNTVNVSIVVTGELEGASITETINFTNDTYEDNLTDTENPASMLATENYFDKLISISLSDGGIYSSSCTCMIYAQTKRAVDRRLRLAAIEWNGEVISSIRDIRPISTTIRDPLEINVIEELGKNIISANTLSKILAGDTNQYTLLVSEDFRSVQYLDTKTVNWKISPYGMDTPIIPASILDSSVYTECYRSRIFKCEAVSSSSTSFAIMLHGANDKTIKSSSVRIICSDNGISTEYLAIPTGAGMFLIYLPSSQPETIQFVISGRAAGFSAINLPNTILSGYEV